MTVSETCPCGAEIKVTPGTTGNLAERQRNREDARLELKAWRSRHRKCPSAPREHVTLLEHAEQMIASLRSDLELMADTIGDLEAERASRGSDCR